MNFSLSTALHHTLLRLTHGLERRAEQRIYPDSQAIRFQLPKGLDPRSEQQKEQGAWIKACAEDRRQPALDLYYSHLERIHIGESA